MKKAVIFYPHIGEYGGVERNIIALATEVIRQGHIPVLVCFYDHINMPGYLDGLITVKLADHQVPFIKSYRIKRWLQQNNDDILGLPLFFGGKAGFYGAIFNSNYVLHYTDPPSLLSDGQETPGLKKPVSLIRSYLSSQVTRNGVQRAKVCITMTNWNARELESIYGRHFEVIYQGGMPPIDNINQAQRCENAVLSIFSISRLTSSKNLDWILEAAHHIKNNMTPLGLGFDKIEIVIAGTGPQIDYLKELAKKLGLAGSVYFPGFLSNAEVEDQYNKTDLFLVPARQGYGLPVLEALYRHVPVVINKESRISELLAGNPWVAISENTVDDFKSTVVNHISQLKKHYADESALLNLPTEQGWAFEIGQKCQWW
jgi:glycosyltransferase involved in cell wall biosynthesis